MDYREPRIEPRKREEERPLYEIVPILEINIAEIANAPKKIERKDWN